MEVNNYPNWLVSVGQAKRLKEIGFDVPCQFFLPIKMYEDFDTRELEFDFQKENHNESVDYWSIPSFEQAFEWFRKKGLYSFILFDNTYPSAESETFSFEIRKINRKLIYSSEDNSTDEFGSYEAAREALINRLIEVYKMSNVNNGNNKKNITERV